MPTKYRDLSPEALERVKAWGREYYQRRKDDPEYIQQRRDWYQRKIEKDPGFYLGKYKKNPEHYAAYARQQRQKNRVVSGRPGSLRYEAKLAGYRSGFEKTVATNLKMRKVPFDYEAVKLPYELHLVYNPDLFLPDQNIYIEIKGLLDYDDRRKHLAVKRQHPELDIRFCFMSAHKKIPHLKSTHAEWATRNGFPWCDGEIPEEWLHE